MADPQSCSTCGATFACGHSSGHCWCCDYPAIMPADFSCGCRCPQCLAKAIASLIGEQLRTLSHEQALELASPFARSPRLIEHIDYTLENDLTVFTPWYLLKKGRCCQQACRHCPYPVAAT